MLIARNIPPRPFRRSRLLSPYLAVANEPPLCPTVCVSHRTSAKSSLLHNFCECFQVGKSAQGIRQIAVCRAMTGKYSCEARQQKIEIKMVKLLHREHARPCQFQIDKNPARPQHSMNLLKAVGKSVKFRVPKPMVTPSNPLSGNGRASTSPRWIVTCAFISRLFFERVRALAGPGPSPLFGHAASGGEIRTRDRRCHRRYRAGKAAPRRRHRFRNAPMARRRQL